VSKRVLPGGDLHEFASLDEFLEADSYDAGLIVIHHLGLPIDIKYDPRGFSVTTVYFNAAITNPRLTYPFFTGAGVSEGLPSNRIHIHDPSLYLEGGLKLAWYAGSSVQPSLQEAIVKILTALIPRGQRVVLFGSSGGRFAALLYAASLPNALVVPVNPQTDVARYNPRIVARYAKLAWGVEGEDPISRIPVPLNVLDVYRRPVSNRVWYVQNSGDTSHVRGHLEPFVDAVHPENDVSVVTVAAGDGHVPPPRKFISAVLRAAVDDGALPAAP